jgi:hypothetical protein
MLHTDKEDVYMEKNKICLKTVNEIRDKDFFIPDYQRGYRWAPQQVTDLLNDINTFRPEHINDSEKTWYCMQPLIVKQRESEYVVIDGQQRLTTIYLILFYLNSRLLGDEREKLFDLKYQTRIESGKYLKDDIGKKISDDSNVDFFYMSTAYDIIKKWFEKQREDVKFDINDFGSKLKFFTKFIWYETANEDEIEVFKRINKGKIPLTNSELIKALFLNSDNFRPNDYNTIYLKQLEIAAEWDRIECALQDDAFWYFVNHKQPEKNPRIEFLFDLMREMYPQKQEKTTDEYSTFRYFNNKFQCNDRNELEKNWKEIKVFYQHIEECYVDRELYHKIGYLVAAGKPLANILSEKQNNKTRMKFIQYLNTQIGESIPGNIDELEYKDGKVRNVLLLHNIQTMLNNANETTKFPFDRYYKEKWDIEHISAIAEHKKLADNEEEQKKWLEELREFIDDEKLKEKIVTGKYIFESLYNEILVYFSEYRNSSVKEYEEIDDISNLVLLDCGTNRSYKNAVFPVKRRKIIKRDKKGTFIPICTKNVFMKFYSPKIENMGYWSSQDGEFYINDIKKVLGTYFEEKKDE